jgi:hypothetical protein
MLKTRPCSRQIRTRPAAWLVKKPLQVQVRLPEWSARFSGDSLVVHESLEASEFLDSAAKGSMSPVDPVQPGLP